MEVLDSIEVKYNARQGTIEKIEREPPPLPPRQVLKQKIYGVKNLSSLFFVFFCLWNSNTFIL